ncbi:hypothetical protein [Gallibacterium anatis]|uniref:hypothetical protein n=1 Tax=Gallibacterium anatis TaxID=750 RepID=UPI0039FD565B
MQNEINLLDWRSPLYRQRLRRLALAALLLIILSATIWYFSLQYERQQRLALNQLNSSYQELSQQLQQIENKQLHQRKILSNQVKLEKLSLDDINFFMTNLSHLPLNGALLNLVRIEINPFSQEQRNSTVFMLSGEKIDQQSFYALQQHLLAKWLYPITFLTNELIPDEQKLYRFKLDFSKSKEE